MSIAIPQNQFKKVLVIGAGAVGGYCGVCLAAAGLDGTFIGRGGSAQFGLMGRSAILRVNG